MLWTMALVLLVLCGPSVSSARTRSAASSTILLVAAAALILVRLIQGRRVV